MSIRNSKRSSHRLGTSAIEGLYEPATMMLSPRLVFLKVPNWPLIESLGKFVECLGMTGK